MDKDRKSELNKKIEQILDESFSGNSAWEKIKELAEKEGNEEVYLTLLENIVDDLLQNEKQVKNFLKQINWKIDNEKSTTPHQRCEA